MKKLREAVLKASTDMVLSFQDQMAIYRSFLVVKDILEGKFGKEIKEKVETQIGSESIQHILENF